MTTVANGEIAPLSSSTEILASLQRRAAELDAQEAAIAAERQHMARVRVGLCGFALPVPDCTEIVEAVSLETTGCAEYPFALQVQGTLVEMDDADYHPEDLVSATVTAPLSAAELRILGQALLTAAGRLDGAQ